MLSLKIWGNKNRAKDRAHGEAIEQEKMVRIEKAETELFDLKIRAHRAATVLSDRAPRNHWREAIEGMIQGVG